MYSVLIVEDQSMPRKLFEIIINSSDNYTLAASVADADIALTVCQNKKVDLILMDVITEFGSSGLKAAQEIKKAFPDIKIIIVTSMPEFSWLERAKEIGVDSFWYKDASQEDIIYMMDETMAGNHIYPDMPPQVKIGDTDNYGFSNRELEILKELLTGESNGEIGARLGISSGTVKRHVENMLAKTGFRTRTELVAEAGRLGIVIRDK